MIRMKNKRVLITGSSKGIGKAIAIEMAKCGAEIFLNYHRSEQAAQCTAREIFDLGATCHLMQADLTVPSEIKNLFSKLDQNKQQIDVLVNNTGILQKNYLFGISEADWDATINTNLKSVFLCSKYAARSMARAKQGCIINIISTAVEKVMPLQSAYIASKAGVKGLTAALAKELGRYGVRVNGVSPGPVFTDMNSFTDEEKKKIIKKIPLNKEITATDIAHAVILLASDYASGINGQILCVDGGLSL